MPERVTATMCSWCHQAAEVGRGAWPRCAGCGHRADVARMLCDCARCRGGGGGGLWPLDLADYLARHGAADADPVDRAAALFAAYVRELEGVAALAAELLTGADDAAARGALRAALDRVMSAAGAASLSLDMAAAARGVDA